MARFANTRKHLHVTVEPAQGEGILARRVTLYGEGIHEATMRAQPGDVIGWTQDGDTFRVYYIDADGVRYSACTKPESIITD